MKLVYLTSKNYPASTADHVYVLELARGFFEILKDDFLLVVNRAGDDLGNLPVREADWRYGRLRTIFYFFWLPCFVISRKQYGHDTIFFSNDPNLLLVLFFWRTVFRYRVVSDWHMLFNDWRDRLIMRKSNELIATSQKLKNAIIRISGVDDKKIDVAYGGIDLSLYQQSADQNAARVSLGIPQDKYIVAYIGFFKTLGMEKGVGTMIESMPLLPQNVVMLFVGGSEQEIEEYGSLAAKLGVRGRCVFIGKKRPDELPAYEQASDLLAIPYPDLPHFRNYGFPMKVYEYMASKTPIVYSKLELVEEVISDCAFGFTPGSAQDFARAVTEAMSHPDTSKAYADRAYAKVQEYTWTKKARRIADFLELV